MEIFILMRFRIIKKNRKIKIIYFHFFFIPIVPFIYGKGDSIFDYLGLIIAEEKSANGLLSLIGGGDEDLSFS